MGHVKDEQVIWLLPDTHLYHFNLPDLDPRRPKDFTERVLANLSVVQEDDVLLHMGDVCIGQDNQAHHDLFDACAAQRKILIRGNHDKKSDSWYYKVGWSVVVEWLTMFKYGHSILFSHVPIPRGRVKPTSVNIHAHTHGNSHRSVDVGGYIDPTYHVEIALENSNYQPVKLSDKLLPKNLSRRLLPPERIPDA